jgi:threonine synthase
MVAGSKDAIQFQVGMTGLACATLSGQTEMMQDGSLEVATRNNGLMRKQDLPSGYSI